MPRTNKHTPLFTESPEETGNWRCTCGNTTEFVGIDDHGYGGPDACENPDCGDVCECETELTQPFTVENNELDYDRFEGGGYDAEIGDYTRIYCGKCDQLLWINPNDELALAGAQER